MKGILMTPSNAQKCFHETKWQTRRPITEHVAWISGWGDSADYSSPAWGNGCFSKRSLMRGVCDDSFQHFQDGPIAFHSPYKIGDLVYIKEAHYAYGEWQHNGYHPSGRVRMEFLRDNSFGVRFINNPPPTICSKRSEYGWFKRSSLFLPADDARTIVVISGVCAHPIRGISENDCEAEGLKLLQGGIRSEFAVLWASINGQESWDRNDWVFAYTFRKYNNRLEQTW